MNFGKPKFAKVQQAKSVQAIPRCYAFALEPRILFDGAAAATTDAALAEPAAEPTAAGTENSDVQALLEAAAAYLPPSVEPANTAPRTEILFIENNVADYQTLIDGAKTGIEIHVLDASRDGLAQMADILEGRSGIDAIHIVSHGSEASLGLGSLTLTTDNLQEHVADLTAIGNALDQDADVFLYGCNVAKGSVGASFIAALADGTQADIAASTDATGSASLGGDWVLESATGYVSSIFVTSSDFNYDQVLAAPRVLDGGTAIYVRPGGTSYTWTYGVGLTPPGLTTNSAITDIDYHNADFPPTGSNSGEDWVLTRGKFQYSTDGGSNWSDYAYPANGNTNFVSVAGKIWRFVDNLPGDTTTSNNIGNAYYVTGHFGQSVGTGSSINPDNAPTNIVSDKSYFLSDTTQGTAVATLTPTDTGLTTGGYWEIDSQSVANLFTISSNTSVGNTATLSLGSGTMPGIGQTATVTARYYDLYQTDASGNPVNGQGFSKTFTFTVVDGQSQDLNFGNDLNVSTTATNDQLAPAVTTLSNGNFVAVWQSAGQDGEASDKNGIYGQIYDATGAAVGGEFAITAAGNGINEISPVVSALDNGRFAVAYLTTPGANGLDVAYRIVEANGTVGSQLIANTTVANDQYYPSITTLTDGSFVIAWTDYASDFSSGKIQVQKFNAADGSKNGSEVAIAATGLNVSPSLAALSNGAYVVAWGDGTAYNINAVVSTALSTVISVTSDGGASSVDTFYPLPRVTGLVGGGFVVAWDSYANDLANYSQTDIFFQRYNNAGVAQGSITQVNTTTGTGTYKYEASIAALSGGGFMVGWQADTGDYDLNGVFGRRFTSAGVAVDATDFEINQYRRGDQNSPVLTALATDLFATVWVDNTSDTSSAGIEARVLMLSNAAPVLTAGATLAYTENGSAAGIDATITVSDADDANISGATVTLSSGFTSGDSLGFSTQNGITGSYNSGTGVLTLSGTATKAQYQIALRSVTYSNSSDTPTSSSASRTVTWAVTDANASPATSSGVTSTVNVTAVNDTPVLTAGATLPYTEGGSAAAIDTTITLSDADDANIAGATVTLSAGFTSGDTLGFSTQNGITGSYNSGTGVLTLSGTATKAQYQTALRSVTYASSSATPTSSSSSRTVTWAVTDANAASVGAQTSSGVTSTINVTASNAKPVLTAGATQAYTEAGLAAAIDATITLSDADDANMTGATVTLSSGFTSGDTLGFSDQNGISGSYNSGTGVLTLSGTASKAQYQTALRSVTYSSTSTTPALSSASRTVTWAATDANAESLGAQTSNGVTSTINVTATNTKPVLTAGAALAYTENGSAAAIDTTVTVSDTDDANMTGATVTISSVFTSGDALGFSSQNGITGSYNSGTGVLTLTGTATKSQYETALRSVTYSSTSENPTGTSASRTITWAITDANAESLGAQTSTGVTSSVNLTAVNDAPTAIALSATTASTYDSGSNVAISSLSRTDVDGGGPTYSIVSVNTDTSGATYNLFNISGTTLQAASPSTTTPGNYTVVIRVNDGDNNYDQSFTIVVTNALVVDTTTDDADGGSTYAAEKADGTGLSLREAVGIANRAGGGTISFASGLGTVSLGSSITIGENIILDADVVNSITVGGDIAIASGKTLNVTNGSGDMLTLSGNISGAGSLTKSGVGTLVLSGSNSYSGDTALAAGTLSIGGDANLGSDSATVTLSGGNLTITSAGTIDDNLAMSAGATITNANAVTLSGNLTGNNALTKGGAGELTLSGTNVLASSTVIGGTLTIADSTNLGTGAVTLNGGSLTVTGSGVTVSNAVALTGDGTIINANAVALSGIVSGTGALTKAGAGVLTLSGDNTYSGSTAVNTGTLVAAHNNALGTAAGSTTVASGASLGLQGGVTVAEAVSAAGTGISSAGAIYNVSGTNILSGNMTLTGAAFMGVTSDQLTLSGNIGGGFNITKAGAGTLILSGSNSYNNTSVSAGTLSLATDGNLGSGTVTLAGGTTLVVTGATTIDNAVALSGNATLDNSAAVTLPGAISGAGTTLTKSGAGTLTLSSTSNSAATTTALTVTGGTLSVGAATTMIGGTLTLNGGSLTISGSGDTYANAITLANDATITNANAATLSGQISGSAAMTKAGAGSLTLSNTGNSSAAATLAVTAGTLSVASDSRLLGGAVTLNGGTLNLNNAGNIDNAIVLGAGNGTVSVTNGAGTLSGNITGTGSLTKTGGQLLTLSGTNDYSGGTTVRGAGISVASGANLGSGAVALEANLTITGTATVGNAIAINADATITNANAVTLSGVLSGSSTLTKAGAGTLTLTGANTHAGAVTVSAGGLTLIGGSSIGDSSAVTVDSGATMTLGGGNETIGSLAGAGNVVLGYRLTVGGDNTSTNFSGVISGSGNGLTKTGSGTLMLTGNNTYTGSTSVAAGMLTANRVGGALADTTAVSVASGATFTAWTDEAIGSIAGAGNVSLNSGTLTVGGDGTSTELSGVISGAGDLGKTGSGTFALSGSNTYTGSTTVSAGTLEAKNAAALGTAGAGTTVSSGAALAIQGGVTLAESLTLNGNGLSGTGALVNVSGINTVSGGVTLGTDSTIGTTAGSLTLSGAVSGGFALSKLGGGTLIMSATSNYTGGTNISAGTLLVTGSLGATSGVSVSSGATLGGTGSIFAASSTNNLTINDGATLAPGVAGTNNGIGRLTVNGNLRVSGAMEAELAGAGGVGGTDFDQVAVNGIVSLNGGSLSVTRVGGHTATSGNTYRLIDNDGIDAVTGAPGIFGGIAEGAELSSNGDIYTVSYASGTGNDVVLTAAVPIVIDVNHAPTGDVTISGTAVVGETLSVSTTLADADGLGSIVYTWTDGNGNILGTGPSLVLTQADVDKTIIVTASYTDGLGKVETVSSTATVAVASGNATNATQTVEFNTNSSGGFSGGSFTTGTQIPTNLIQPINTGSGLGAGGAPTGPGGGSGGSGALSTGGSAGGLGGGLGDSLGNGTGGGFGFGPSIFSSSFGDSGTSSTSTQTTSLQMEAQLDTGSNNSFTMPAEALLGLDTSTGVSFQAAQANGGSLPAWVSFDSGTGRLSLKEGGGERTVVKITATDGKGNQTVITVVLKPQQPGQRQNGEGRPGGQEGRGGQGRPNQSRPVGGEPRAQLGKMPLSAQLQGFGTQRTHQDADALLENLARVFAEPRDAA